MTNQIKKIVLGILVVMLVGFNIQQWGFKKPSSSRRSGRHLVVVPPGMGKIDPKQKSAVEDYQKLLGLLRGTQSQPGGRSNGDPFQKFDLQQVEGGGLPEISNMVLTGIIIEEQGPTALINEKIVKIGDSIGEYQVGDIKQNEVILKKGTEKYILRLFKE
jgi:hypothetical protein